MTGMGRESSSDAQIAASTRLIEKGGVKLDATDWNDDVLDDYFERGWRLVEESPAATGHQARVEAIQYERRTRNWTPDLWRSDTPEGMHWPARVAQVQREADAAVDSLIAEVEAEYARLGR